MSPTPYDMNCLENSGDAQIDRRFSYATQFAERGDYTAAIDLLQQCVDLMSHWPPLHFHLGLYYQAIQNRDAAVNAYKTYLQYDAADRMGASVKLALLGAMESPDYLPSDYVRALFDQYAPRFDSALIETLDYSVPQLLYEAVDRLRPASENTQRILDLGCGTGLAGERFLRRAACLDGIDLSEGMIAQARAKQIYNQLDTADMAAWLNRPATQPYDLILAADVFVYVGALDHLIPAIAGHMAPGALLAFSVQKTDGDGFVLGADHRFAHSKPYLDHVLAASGLILRHMGEEILRKDGGKAIHGYLVAAEKPPATLGTGLAMLQDQEDGAVLEPPQPLH